MDSWLTKYKSWRTFIFNNYHNRLLELLRAIDSVTFMNLEERLERYLKDRIRLGKTNLLEVTHHQIAIDLNSSRVVISRLLKKMEKKGIVTLGRNFIEFTPEIDNPL
jgi:CRP/FNR family transcriptional regulator